MMKAAEFIQGKGYVVVISRTNRTKTASLTVDDGEVMLVVPKELTSDRIEKIIQGRHTWIIKKIASHLEATPATSKQYVSGEAFPYLGRNYRLKVVQGEYQAAKLINGRLQIGLAESKIQDHFARGALVHWYKRNAERKLREKAERYAKIVGVTLASIHIKSFKTRWGSCTPKGDLDFNWVIVMAPNRIVDYVVVHELCHLIHMDHSFKFWLEVERVMPDYKECREWLKVNGHTLVV